MLCNQLQLTLRITKEHLKGVFMYFKNETLEKNCFPFIFNFNFQNLY